MSLNPSSGVLDVVIVGGGLVGGLTALLLAQGGVQATVLDAAPILDADKLKRSQSAGFGFKSGDHSFIKTVGVWDKLARQQPYTGMQVWNKMATVKLTLVILQKGHLL